MIPTDELHAKLKADNLRTYLETELLRFAGEPNQRERYEAGVLPDVELTSLARTILFRPFEEFQRWRKLEARDIRHKRSHEVALETVTFSALPLATLTGPQWESLKKYAAAIDRANAHEWVKCTPDVFTLQTRCHTATCGICKAQYEAASVLVSVIWAGRPLSREYAL